jgi:ferrous iron transport protein A
MTTNLCDVASSVTVRIKALQGEPGVCQRLREMGFCEFARIRKISEGGALICHVCGVNVILSRHLAKNILVEALHSSSLSQDHSDDNRWDGHSHGVP